MRDLLVFVLIMATLAAFWGIIKPYRNISRGKFFLIFTALSFGVGLALPPPTPEQIAAKEAKAKAEAAAQAKEDAAKIAAKAKPGIDAMIKYERADNPQTYALVGSEMFKRLNDLEPGAILAAAESKDCNSVTSGAVSLNQSAKGAPKWFVDCENGNRFMIDAKQAEAALARSKADQLALADLKPSCTTKTVAMCSASDAQKAANETEVVSFCDITIKEALISDSSMDWGWKYQLGKKDEIQVIRGFKAENAYGAKLKHRYVCTFDAGTQRIKRLVIEGPFGTQRVI